jgi:hypothetical protein
MLRRMVAGAPVDVAEQLVKAQLMVPPLAAPASTAG